MTDDQYSILVNFFYNLKVLHGPEFVNATLKRHKRLYLLIQDYEKRTLIDIENALT